MNNPPIPPLEAGVTQPAGGVHPKSATVRQLRDDIRSPKLPQAKSKAIVYSRSRVTPKTNPHPAIVEEWYR